MQWMLDEAEYFLRIQPELIILLDGRPFSKKYQVDAVVNFSKQIKTPWRIIECVCPESLTLQRIQADKAAHKHIARNRDSQLYHRVKASFQPIRRRKLVLQTSSDLSTCLQQIERYLST